MRRKINKMLFLDYVDEAPNRAFRAEIDIPLGYDDYNYLKELLDRAQTDEIQKEIVRLLLRELGTPSKEASPEEWAQNKAARNFLAAAFDQEPPN